MPSRRITMRKIKEVLRLRYACGLSLEQIARAQNLSKGVVAKYLKRATAAGIDDTTAQTLDESDLVERLKPHNDTPRQSSFIAPDFAAIHGPRPAPQAQKCHVAVAVGRLPRPVPRSPVPLHQLLRPISRVCQGPEAFHAPSPPRRREVVCRWP